MGAKILSDGRESLFLDYYFGYADRITRKVSRRRESLKLYLHGSPRTAEERARNRDTVELAKRIRFEREQDMKNDLFGYRLGKGGTVNFLEYFRRYIGQYAKRDVMVLELAFRRFTDFIAETPVYSWYGDCIPVGRITKDMVIAFTEYLKGRSTGEGAHSIYARFRKVLRKAVEDGTMLRDPSAGVTVKADGQMLKKDVLSLEEIGKLAATKPENMDPDIRRAFVFCLYTGMRYCDMKDLTYANVDYSNRLLKFEQKKTAGHSAGSGVIIPLNDDLLKLIGRPCAPEGRQDRIFSLPSYTTSLRVIKAWVRQAGIDKHISWHCARQKMWIPEMGVFLLVY